jgi:hypothetical protein
MKRYNDTGFTLTMQKVRLAVGMAPTGASLIVDVLLNGASIFTSTPKPRILAGQTTGVAVPNTTAWPDGSFLTVDVTQIGSTVAGSNLTVTVAIV